MVERSEDISNSLPSVTVGRDRRTGATWANLRTLIRFGNVHELLRRSKTVDPDRPRSIPEHIHLQRVGSSSDVLLRMADQDAAEHTLVVAQEQTAARGGSGPWEAPPGGLWFSTLWQPDIDPCSAALITLAAGWGVREGIRRQTGVGAGIKWPNDLIIDGRKVGGVLVEGMVSDHRVTDAVVGVGVNVNNPIHELPDPLTETATSLQEATGRDIELTDLLDAITHELIQARDLLEDPDELIAKVNTCWTQRGQEVTLDSGYALIQGQARRIEPDGTLLIENEGAAHRVDDPSLAKFVRVVAPGARQRSN